MAITSQPVGKLGGGNAPEISTWTNEGYGVARAPVPNGWKGAFFITNTGYGYTTSGVRGIPSLDKVLFIRAD